ncbi:hypothetical protein IAU60_002702 [Kwoniella sp. DSM 27419]
MDEESMMNAAGPSTPVSTALTGPSQVGTEAIPGTSKSAMKRAAKQARAEELKPLKRAAEKERRKIRAAQLAEGYAKGTLSEGDREIVERRKRLEKERKVAKRKLEHGEQGDEWRGGVVVDLGFDHLMNEQEINSMSSQLGYVYSHNRTAKRPFSTILHTTFSPSASPNLWARMSITNWDKWSRSYWWHEGLPELNKAMRGEGLPEAPPVTEEAADLSSEGLETHLSGPTLPPGLDPKRHTLVYLSADAEEELSTLSEDEVYIIGGIVDRNRYKNLCQNKADILGLRTARLPIGTFLANMPTRKVLTVNQVFEILVQYIAMGDWRTAFEAVIPQRKYHDSRKAKKDAKERVSSGDVQSAESPHDAEQEEAMAVDEGTAAGADAVVMDEEAMMNL